jgi:hypothetical protein
VIESPIPCPAISGLKQVFAAPKKSFTASRTTEKNHRVKNLLKDRLEAFVARFDLVLLLI